MKLQSPLMQRKLLLLLAVQQSGKARQAPAPLKSLDSVLPLSQRSGLLEAAHSKMAARTRVLSFKYNKSPADCPITSAPATLSGIWLAWCYLSSGPNFKKTPNLPSFLMEMENGNVKPFPLPTVAAYVDFAVPAATIVAAAGAGWTVRAAVAAAGVGLELKKYFER